MGVTMTNLLTDNAAFTKWCAEIMGWHCAMGVWFNGQRGTKWSIDNWHPVTSLDDLALVEARVCEMGEEMQMWHKRALYEVVSGHKPNPVYRMTWKWVSAMITANVTQRRAALCAIQDEIERAMK